MSCLKEKQKDICKNCGEPFDKTRPWKTFCSPKCRMTHYENCNPRVKTVKGIPQ